MISCEKNVNWKSYVIISSVFLAGITLLAVYTRMWVLTAIPIGLLFGFFLKKGELCGSSAFSEVIMMKDRSKVLGALDRNCCKHGGICSARHHRTD